MNEVTFPQLKNVIDQTAEAFEAFKKTNDQRTAALQDRIEELEAKGMITGRTGTSAGEPVRYLKTQSGEQLPYLSKAQRFADLGGSDREAFDIGAYCRAAIMGGAEGKVASGSMLVPTGVGSQIIDMIRARTVVIEAGAGTIRISGPTNLAKLTGDPDVIQHTEAANDITESDITAAAVALNPKLLAALIPLTVELVEDSPNLDQLLRTSISAAFASKIDTLAIAKIVASGLPASAAAHDPATWTGTNLAIAAALAANQGLPTAHISTAANYAARSVILASTAGSWLGRPPYLSGMQELFTTSVTADTAIFGNFAEAVAIAIRSDLTLEVVRHGKPGYGSHLLVAHARADAVVLQPTKLFHQKKVP